MSNVKRISQLSSDVKLFVSTTGTSSEDPKRPSVAVIEEILDELEGITVTTELLKKTQLGIHLNRLRKHKDASDALKSKAKQLIDTWKSMIKSDSPYDSKPVDVKKSEPSPLPLPTVKTTPAPPPLSESNANTPTSTTSEFATAEMPKVTFVAASGNATRDKCTEMLLNSLIIDDLSSVDKNGALYLARRIEAAIFKDFRAVDAKYKAKLRSKIFNLKGNSKLRIGILFGEIEPEEFTAMSASDMANEEIKEKDAALHKLNLMDAQEAAPQQSETDQFKCGKCKQRRTKYYQLQTRSADEPMTTFVTCINCGNRWKFC